MIYIDTEITTTKLKLLYLRHWGVWIVWMLKFVSMVDKSVNKTKDSLKRKHQRSVEIAFLLVTSVAHGMRVVMEIRVRLTKI